MKVVIIGSGNVAEECAIALKECNITPIQICARNRDNGSNLADKIGCEYTDDFKNIAEADIYIISVSDNAIEKVSSQLNIGNAIVVHTAGSVDMQSLSKHKNFGVLYPLQTFTKGRHIDFSEIPILIESNNTETLDTIKELAKKLTDNVIETDLNYRSKVHVAAVFACNFSNHMYAIAENLLNCDNIPFDIIKPLIKETTNKVLDAKSPLDVQTGPAIRDDFKTKIKHCEMLTDKIITKNIYVTLSQNIWEISKKTYQK